MVRKTTAEVKTSTKPNTNNTTEDTVDIASLLQNARAGIQENWMTLAGLVLILLWLIQLWEQILGMILLTTWILLISGFFWKNNK